MSTGDRIIIVLVSLAALGLGLFFITCEGIGVYEYLHKAHGLGYMTLAGLGVVAMLAVAPLLAETARRHGHGWSALVLWLSVPMCLTVVLSSAVTRTGAATDADEAARIHATQAAAIAVEAQGVAKVGLVSAQESWNRECRTGHGPKCDKATTVLNDAKTRYAAANAALTGTPANGRDPLAARLAAMFPGLQEATVRLWWPLLLPLVVAIGAEILITASIRLLPRAFVSRAIVEQVNPLSLYEFAADRLERGAEHLSLPDFYRAYAATARDLGRRPVGSDAFATALRRLSDEAGLTIEHRDDEELYLANVRLTELAEGAHP